SHGGPRLGRQLEQPPEVGGLAGKLATSRHDARQLGALADQLLCAPIVVPERGGRHLGVERCQPRFLDRQVKGASEARPRVGSARRRLALSRSASTRSPSWPLTSTLFPPPPSPSPPFIATTSHN